jgi:hypothetical protein
MFSFTEIRGQSSTLDKSGTIEINTEYCTTKKPLWLLTIKLLCTAAMIAVGYGILLPSFFQLGHPPLQAIVMATAVMIVYVGIAFYIRPEANTDNMGWGGGFANDPTQYSDNINRFLWNLHCFLAPGRYTASTALDWCVFLGVLRSDEAIPQEAEESPGLGMTSAFAAKPIERPRAETPQDAPLPPAPAMSPSRFESPAPAVSSTARAGQFSMDGWKKFYTP